MLGWGTWELGSGRNLVRVPLSPSSSTAVVGTCVIDVSCTGYTPL
jgi:hypothetical protein